MAEKIKEMDQNNWQCYKFDNGAYYYGEAGYLDQSGIVHAHDNAEMANNPKAKLVKHGFGIYVYKSENNGEHRYEGIWEKDEKNGEGILRMPGGAIYEGKWKEGFYHGMGKLVWSNGDVYEGNWKRNRMDGPGLFKRNDGTTLKGSFKNNFYIDGQILRNPFMPDAQYEEMKKRRKQIHKQYEKNEKIKSGYFEKVPLEKIQTLPQLLAKSSNNNRVPLLIASQESGLNLKQVSKNLGEVKIIDLRKSFMLDGENKFNYKKQISSMVQEAMIKGEVLIISLDESADVEQFNEMFYPDIHEIYEANGLNQTLWSPKYLRKSQIKSKIINQNEVHEQYRMVVWSKIKYPQNTNQQILYEKIRKRFQYVIPFIKIDIIFMEKIEKPAQEPQEAN